jgi:hypothetical protein
MGRNMIYNEVRTYEHQNIKQINSEFAQKPFKPSDGFLNISTQKSVVGDNKSIFLNPVAIL